MVTVHVAPLANTSVNIINRARDICDTLLGGNVATSSMQK